MKHRAGLALLVAVAALIGAGRGLAAIQVAITSPADGAHSLSGVVDVAVSASADQGIYSVQLYVDGQPYGLPNTTPVSPYQYVIPWNTSGVAQGTHALSVLATDWSGASNTLVSAPVAVDVGPAYPTIQITSPAAWSFARGTTQIQVAATSAVGPGQVSLTVDGAPVAASWDTTRVPDGSHAVQASITDGRGKSAADSRTVTVDNTPPTTFVTVPTANAFASGSLPVEANASDAFGIAGVQFAVDGTPVGPVLAAPTSAGGYLYSSAVDLGALAGGPHTLTSIAVDAAGNRTVSAPVAFTIGTPPPSVVVTLPPDWSFASKTVPVTAQVTGGTAPLSAQLLVDGVASGSTLALAPFVFPWDTTKVADGGHSVQVRVTDAQGRSALSALLHETVDNTAPSAILYQPVPNARLGGVATFQAHASDAYGVTSVQFRVDGAPVGAPLTKPDTGQLYLYSLAFDTTALTPGTHTVTAVAADGAGNTTTTAGVTITTGPLRYLPVLNYHEIDPPDGASIYDQTLAEADAQLAYLKQNGYQSVSLAQYQTWLSGRDIGVAKPVLITVDDGLASELAWDPLLQKYGFKAVMFVITGYADNKTPGDADPTNLSWSQIQALAGNGRWEIAFHAGEFGHGDSYDSGASISGMTYPTGCPYFYTCLGQIVTGRGRNARVTPESVAAYKALVTKEVTDGIAELRQKVPSVSLLAWAAPFNDAGQWTNLYNDASGQVQAWFPGFMASKFPIVFVQTNPIQYAQASGLVGSLTAFNRRYRFEVHTDTTIQQFAAALSDPAFAR
jgi:hypothetical protein